ncbi:MAG: DUF2334 domain-containing protein [Candidatus Thorarchaeota archaeon]|nr:DUF2334 domain-containing protein [Candidatus Thorarchaeota archaeon]
MRKAVEPVEDQTILLSIHDITPVHEDDIVRTCDLLTDMGISSLTLLVTPFYAMKKTNSFSRGSLFSEYLLSLGLEISLHGYSHFTKSGTMNEFSSITSEKAKSRLLDGINLVRTGFGKKPVGFVPPLWEAPPRILKSLKEAGLVYGVENTNIHRFSDSRTFSTGANIISQGKRTVNTESAIFEMELGGSLQIGIHPTDYRMNNILDLLSDLKDRQDYSFVGYRDYLSGKK